MLSSVTFIFSVHFPHPPAYKTFKTYKTLLSG